MGLFDEHIREQDSNECRACGERFPCETRQREIKYEWKAAATALRIDGQGYKNPFDGWTDEEIAEATAIIEQKRKRQIRRERAIETSKRRDKQMQELLEGTTWRTADGRTLDVSEMTPNHAGNTLRMIESGRHPAGGWAMRQACGVEGFVGYGFTGVAVSRIGTWPLTEALWRRSQEGPTLRERFADFRSARAYQKKNSFVCRR